MISDSVGLSRGIALLGAVWALASVALIVARSLFYDKDVAKLKAE